MHMADFYLILSLFLLPVFGAYRNILPAVSLFGQHIYNQYGHGGNNIRQGQQLVIQPVQPEPVVQRRQPDRIPDIVFRTPSFRDIETLEDKDEDVAEDVQVKEDPRAVFLRICLFAYQKAKIEELEAKVQDSAFYKDLYEDRHKEYIKMAEILAQYREANQVITKKLDLAEKERDQALSLLDELRTNQSDYNERMKKSCEQSQKSMEALKYELEDARSQVTEKNNLVSHHKNLLSAQTEAIKIAIDTESCDIVKAAELLKDKAKKRKVKLLEAREKIYNLELEKANAVIDKNYLLDEATELKIKLEAAQKTLKNAKLAKSEVEETLAQVKKDLDEKISALKDASELCETKETVCQIMTLAKDGLEQKLEEANENLKQANVNYELAVQNCFNLSEDCRKKVDELDGLKVDINRLQQEKVEAALALGLKESDTEDLRLANLAKGIEKLKFDLEKAIEDRDDFRSLNNALLLKLEAVAMKLNTDVDDGLTDRIDELLDELAAEEKSNQKTHERLATVVKKTSDLCKAAEDMNEAHDDVCKERDVLASNQSLLIQKLRDVSMELTTLRSEYLSILVEQQKSNCIEAALRQSLLNERVKIYDLEVVNFEIGLNGRKLHEQALDQKENIESLTLKINELEEQLSVALAKIEEEKNMSKEAQAIFCGIRSQFETQTKEHLELQEQLQDLKSKFESAKISMQQQEQVISKLKHEISLLEEAKGRFLSALGGIFEVELTENNAADKLAEIRDKHATDVTNFQKDLANASSNIKILQMQLLDEVEKLQIEKDGRAEDKISYVTNMRWLGFNIVLMTQYISKLESEITELDRDVRNGIATVKVLMEKLETAEKNHEDLSKKLDQTVLKYVDAMANFELANEALTEMTSSAQHFRELYDVAVGALLVSEEKVAKLTGQREEDQFRWEQVSIKNEEYRLLANAHISSLELKLKKKRAKIVANKQEASSVVRAYEEALSQLLANVEADAMEKLRLQLDLKTEKSARALGESKIEDLKSKVKGLEDDVESLETDKAELEVKKQELDALQIEYAKTVATVEDLEMQLNEEAENLKLEVKERENDQEMYKISLALHAVNMAQLVQYINELDYENKKLDRTVCTRMQTIKILNAKLKRAKEQYQKLSKELDELFFKCIDIEADYELALEELVESQQAHQETLEKLSIANEKVVDLFKLSETVTSERDQEIEHSIKLEQEHHEMTNRLAELGLKLKKKKEKLAIERNAVTESDKAYEAEIAGLVQKVQVDLTEKKLLAQQLFDEKHARKLDKIDIQELEEKVGVLKVQVKKLQDDKTKLMEEMALLETKNTRLEENKIELEVEKSSLQDAKIRLEDENLELLSEAKTTFKNEEERLELDKTQLERLHEKIAAVLAERSLVAAGLRQERDAHQSSKITLEEQIIYLKACVQNLEDDKTKLKNEMTTLETEKAKLEEQKDILELEKGKAEDAKFELEKINTRLLEDARTAFENEDARLQSDGAHLDRLHHQIQAELAEKKKLAKELFAEKEAHQFNIIDAKGLEEKIGELEKMIAILRKDKTKLAKEKNALEDEKSQLKNEKLQLEFDKTQLEVVKNRLVDFKTRLTDDNATLEDAKIRLEVEMSMLEEEQTKLKEDKAKLEGEHEKLIKKSTVPVPVLSRHTTCDCDDCDTLIVHRPSACSSAEILQLVEARAKTLVKVDFEHCKNIKVANAAFFGSGLACLSAASGLVVYWFIKLKPLIAVAAAA